tara:strand:+ start:336 stop:542 length:207 start_codon:yes stop_codon:yes gene_type:complete
MSERLQYTTLAIQLSNDEGLPYDMPDDWLETVVGIASMINAKYKCGIDVVYGLATKEGMDIISEEVGQ